MTRSAFDNWYRLLPASAQQWRTRMGLVTQIIDTGCGASAELWIKGFFQNLPLLVWSIIKPSAINDALYMTDTAHRRGGGQRFKGLSIVQALGSIPRFGLEGTFLMAAGELSQRIGWYMLIADATTDFLVNWTSMVMQYAGCQVGDFPWVRSLSYTGNIGPSALTGTVMWGRDTEGDAARILPPPSGVVVYDGEASAVGFSLVVKPYQGLNLPMGNVEAWLEDDNGNQFEHTGTIKLNENNEGRANGIIFRPQSPYAYTAYHVRYKCTDGYANISDSSISCSIGPQRPILPNMRPDP